MIVRQPFTPLASLALVALLFPTPRLAAQQPSQPTSTTPLPSYDVIAIHENRSATNMAIVGWGDDAFTAQDVTLTLLLVNAYDIRQDLISGLPAWANSVHFNINAKITDADADAIKKLSPEQGRAMIAKLLKERFTLTAHTETKSLPVYDLVIAKGGPKLKENAAPTPDTPDPAQSGPHAANIWMSSSGVIAVAVTMSTFVTTLANHFQRTVIDKTGLTGRYDIHLKWRPDNQESASTDNSAPDLFTAVQEQLGLKLEPSKGPVDTLVIDHVEMPTEN